MDAFEILKMQRDEFLEIKCPYCDVSVERVRLKHHIAQHSEMNSMFAWHYVAQDELQASTSAAKDLSKFEKNVLRVQRYFSVNMSSEDKQRIIDEDIVNKPVLYTDPVYFNKLLMLHHRMKGPLFTHFTQNKEELQFLQDSLRPYFLVNTSAKSIYGTVPCYWKCPDCPFKTYRASFFAAVFLALCHLIKAEDNHGSSLPSELQKIVVSEWVNYNWTFGATLQEKFSVNDCPVNIFDDFLPKADDAQFLASLFCSDLMEKNVFVFCAFCLKRFDNASIFVQHAVEEHKLQQELTFFSVSKNRIGGTMLNELTPHWFPLAYVIDEGHRGKTEFVPPSLHWACYECKMLLVETNRILLLLKVLLHFYFELFVPYSEYLLSKRWPGLLKFLEDIKKRLSRDVEKMSVISFDWFQLQPFVHKSEQALFLSDSTSTRKRILATKNHKITVCLLCEKVFLNSTEVQLSRHLKSCKATTNGQESECVATSLKRLVMEIHQSLSSEVFTVLQPNLNVQRNLLKGYVTDSRKLRLFKLEQRSKVAKVYTMQADGRKQYVTPKRKRYSDFLVNTV